MKKVFSFLFALCFMTKAFAQNAPVKFHIFIKPTPLFFREVALGYEKVVNDRFTTSLLVSYKFANNHADTLVKGFGSGLFGYYQMQNLVNPHYNAIKIGFAPKFFMGLPNCYLSPEISFKYWWFDKKNVRYENVEGYRFDALRSEKARDVNLKLLFGYRFEQPFLGLSEIASVIHISAGLNLTYRRYIYESWGGTVFDMPNTYKFENAYFLIINPFLGLSIGLGKQ